MHLFHCGTFSQFVYVAIKCFLLQNDIIMEFDRDTILGQQHTNVLDYYEEIAIFIFLMYMMIFITFFFGLYRLLSL